MKFNLSRYCCFFNKNDQLRKSLLEDMEYSILELSELGKKTVAECEAEEVAAEAATNELAMNLRVAYKAYEEKRREYDSLLSSLNASLDNGQTPGQETVSKYNAQSLSLEMCINDVKDAEKALSEQMKQSPEQVDKRSIRPGI